MEKFLKIGTTYYPTKNIVSMAISSADLVVTFSGVTGGKTITGGANNVDTFVQEINFGKQVVIDSAAIAALS